MLDVRREGEALIVAWNGALDELAAGAILAAIGGDERVVLDLTRATPIADSALARIAEARPVQFRGLREHQERLLTYLKKAG